VEPEAARFRLFDSLASFLRAAAARRPLLLILDDLHWADAPSLALLRFVARELKHATASLVVGIYRHTEADTGQPLVATLADLTRGQHHRQLLLGGLNEQEVASFVALVAGAESSPEPAAVHQQTDGNPFFVTEVVRLPASQGHLGAAEASAPRLAASLPEGSGRWWPSDWAASPTTAGGSWRSPPVLGRDFQLRVLQPAAAWIQDDCWSCSRRPRRPG
jgi:AAA ATPase domain